MQCWHHVSISFSSRFKSTSTTKITFLKVRKTQKNIVMPMFTKCREHFFLNIHKMQRKHFYANYRCSQTVCQTAQQGGARQRGKGAKLNKRNLTFTISNFSIYTKHYLRHHLRTIQLADERYVKWLIVVDDYFFSAGDMMQLFQENPVDRASYCWSFFAGCEEKIRALKSCQSGDTVWQTVS